MWIAGLLVMLSGSACLGWLVTGGRISFRSFAQLLPVLTGTFLAALLVDVGQVPALEAVWSALPLTLLVWAMMFQLGTDVQTARRALLSSAEVLREDTGLALLKHESTKQGARLGTSTAELEFSVPAGEAYLAWRASRKRTMLPQLFFASGFGVYAVFVMPGAPYVPLLEMLGATLLSAVGVALIVSMRTLRYGGRVVAADGSQAAMVLDAFTPMFIPVPDDASVVGSHSDRDSCTWVRYRLKDLSFDLLLPETADVNAVDPE